MPGINDSVPTTINPGLLSAQNLVAPAAPTITPSAVQALTDSMRSGAITAQDIIDRSSELGKTHRKAQIELHKRAISDLQNPDLIAARHAVELAAGKQANLAGTQAEAAQTLVPAQTQLQAGALAQGLSELGTGIPSATLRQLNLVYNLGAQFDPQTGVLQNPDEVLPALSHVMGGLNGMQIAKELSERVKTEPVTDAQGNTTQVPTWKGTGKPLSPAEKAVINRYQGMMPGLLPGLPPGGASMVQPKAADAHDRAAQGLVQPLGAPAGPPTDEQGNLITAQRTEAEKAKLGMELTEESRKTQSYKDWRHAASFYENALDAISAINKVPIADQRVGKVNLNAKDTELAESVVKMLDPAGVVREFKWNKFESNQPWPEQVRNIMSRVKQEGKFTPETRQELMKIANASIRAREGQAADFLKQSKEKGAPLTDKENALASGQLTPEYVPPTGASSGAATSGVQTRTIPGKGDIISSDGGKTWNWVR
jgi:hypothetical protein